MQISEIFNAAVKLPTSARVAFLDGACGADAQLRSEIESLLRAHDDAGDFLRGPAERTTDFEPIAERPGSHIGPYTLREQIGEGGFGLVFVAEQQHPVRRKVALKVIRPGMDTREVVARFEAERQALAMMDHPNIAKVLDAGTTETSRPFFVMELVKGTPITEYADANNLTPCQRLELFLQVCQAVQHAHQKGVIHRDLKPSNILVAPHDGIPVVKVIDFGVAKALGQQLTDKTVYTRFAAMIGTPLYMSPEQAEVNQLDVDTRSDIYSLGVLLYELLTGTTPFDRDRLKKAAFDEIRRIIKEEEPPRPSTRLTSLGATLTTTAARRGTEPGKLAGVVRGELDWIVMKCLEKDRGRRYETANGLAKDVQRYLSGDAVEACPPTLGYRLRKAYRRNRGAILVGSVIATVLLLATGVSLAFGILAKQAERRAVEQEYAATISAEEAIENKRNALRERDEANQARAALDVERQTLREVNYARSIQLAYQSWLDNNTNRTVRLLEEADPKYRGWEWDYVHRLCHAELFTLNSHPDPTKKSPTYAKYSRDGSRIVTANGALNFNKVSDLGKVIVWDARTGAKIQELTQGTRATSPDFNHDASRVVAIHRKNGFNSFDDPKDPTECIVWDVKTGERVLTLKGHKDRVFSAAYSPDGSRIVTTSFDTTAIVWNAQTGRPLTTHRGNKGKLSSAIFHPLDGTKILSRTWTDGTFYVWDAQSGEIVYELKDDLGAGIAKYSPDGRKIITSSFNGRTRIWDAEKRVVVLTLNYRNIGGYDGSFSPDGKRIATISAGMIVTIWDTQTGKELKTIKEHEVGVVSFNHEGSRILTGSRDGTARVWDTTASDEPPLLPMKDAPSIIVFNPKNASQIAIGTQKGAVKLWDVAKRIVTRPLIQEEEGAKTFLLAVIFSRDGKRLVTVRRETKLLSGATASEVTVWDVKTGNTILVLKGEDKKDYTDASFSPDGKWLVTTSLDSLVRIWNAETGALVRTLEGHAGGVFSASFSPDGKRIVSTGNIYDRTARIWDVATGKELVKFQGHGQPEQEFAVWHAAFSPDGKRVVSTGNRKIIVWDAETGAEVVGLKGTHLGSNVAFSPNGKRLITTSLLGLTIWDAATGQELLTLKGHFPNIRRLEFSPDGTRIPVVTPEGVRLYDSRPVARNKVEPKK